MKGRKNSVQLFGGDCSFEKDAESDEDSKKNDGTAAVEVEVMQETILKKRRYKTKSTINQEKNPKQMSDNELAVWLDELIKNKSMQDFCFT